MIAKMIKGLKNSFLENPYISLILMWLYYCMFWGIFNLKNIICSSPEAKDEWMLPIIPALLYHFVVYLFSAKKHKGI